MSFQAVQTKKIWTKNYPPEVPLSIDPSIYKNLLVFFDECFGNFGYQALSSCMGAVHTYAQVDALSMAVAAWLQALGLPKGSIVALMMPNIPQYLPILMGILRAGYVCTPINPMYTGRELRHQLNDSGAVAIFVLDNFAQALEQVVEETHIRHVILSKIGDLMGGFKGALVNFMVHNVKRMVPKYRLDSPSRTLTKFSTVLSQGEQMPFTPVDCHGDDMAILQYTGGTTGLAKGAILTHHNVIAAALQAEAWFRPATKKITSATINTVLALPLYHIFAFMVTLLGMRSGHTFVLIPNPRDIPAFLKELKKQPFHAFPGVNTLFKGLLAQPKFHKLDFSSLAVTLSGGMPASAETAKAWLETTGCPMIEAWGLTECVATGTANIITDTRFNGKIGIPVPSLEVSVRNDAGEEVPIGTSGELCLRGPNITLGYYRHDNSGVFTSDGFFKTGDIGMMDEKGYFTLLDRKKDVIIVSGFNVYPNEVEEVIRQCDGVVDCAIIGVPDEMQGESIKLYVVPKDDYLTEQILLNHCFENLTGYKCPRYIEFVKTLPKSNVGKVLRQKLREKHFAEHPETFIKSKLNHTS